MKLTCPKDPEHNRFEVSAHVAQTWLVDENCDYVEVADDCIETIHRPDAGDYYVCAECGTEAKVTP